MDNHGFIFSLLLMVSVTTSTFASAIKANNPNGEVKKKLAYVIAFHQILFSTP